MQLQQLYYFKTVGELENISQASKELMVSQPSLSNMIRRIEKELNVTLFFRKGRNVKLTKEGKILFKYAVSIINEMDEMKKELRDYREAMDKQIRMASLNSIYLSRWLSEFIIKYPDYTVTHKLYKIDLMEEVLFKGDLDFVLTTSPLPDTHFENHYLISDRHVLLVPKTHSFANKTDIFFREAKDEMFLSLSVSDNYSRLIDSISKQAGFVPKIVFEGETSLLERLCAAGSGCFIHLKSSTTAIDRDRIHEITLKDSFAKIDLYLCWKKRHTLSPACKAFKNYVINWHHEHANEKNILSS